MLVLSRKPGESICIGDDIIITLVRVSGSAARIGVTAPRNVKIVRSELEKEEHDHSTSETGTDRTV